MRVVLHRPPLLSLPHAVDDEFELIPARGQRQQPEKVAITLRPARVGHACEIVALAPIVPTTDDRSRSRVRRPKMNGYLYAAAQRARG